LIEAIRTQAQTAAGELFWVKRAIEREHLITHAAPTDDERTPEEAAADEAREVGV
jgi:hypothetical protein